MRGHAGSTTDANDLRHVGINRRPLTSDCSRSRSSCCPLAPPFSLRCWLEPDTSLRCGGSRKGVSGSKAKRRPGDPLPRNPATEPKPTPNRTGSRTPTPPVHSRTDTQTDTRNRHPAAGAQGPLETARTRGDASSRRHSSLGTSAYVWVGPEKWKPAVSGFESRNTVLFERPTAGAWHYYAFVIDTEATAESQMRQTAKSRVTVGEPRGTVGRRPGLDLRGHALRGSLASSSSARLDQCAFLPGGSECRQGGGVGDDLEASVLAGVSRVRGCSRDSWLGGRLLLAWPRAAREPGVVWVGRGVAPFVAPGGFSGCCLAWGLAWLCEFGRCAWRESNPRPAA
jgi:hypothetical protein